MAERGIRGNEALVPPFAYRFVTPHLARELSRWLPLSIDGAFRVISYGGIVAELVLTFALARRVASSCRVAFVVMLTVGLSFFNVRFLLFDPYRPDAVAFALALASTWYLLCQRPGVAAFIAAPALIVREFMLGPLLAALDALVRGPGDGARRLAAVALPVCLGTAIIAIPRFLIPVRQNAASIDPTVGDFLRTLLATPLSPARDLNVVFGVACYFLPLLALGGFGRLRAAWACLGGMRRPVVIVGSVTLGLTLYGGTDIARFAAYFVVVQTIVLAAILRQDVSAVEIGLTLVAVAVFNRLYVVALPLEPIDQYLDLFGAYADRVNRSTAWRAIELGAWVIVIRGVGAVVRHMSGATVDPTPDSPPRMT